MLPSGIYYHNDPTNLNIFSVYCVQDSGKVYRIASPGCSSEHLLVDRLPEGAYRVRGLKQA